MVASRLPGVVLGLTLTAEEEFMSIQIAPSLLSADFSRLADEIKALDQAGADIMHLDVMDGHFVPNLTFGAPVIKKLRPHTKRPFESHLMISPFEPYLDAFIDAGSDIILIHPEAVGDHQRALKHIRSRGCKAGLVLNPKTSLNPFQEHIQFCDQLLIMTVEPGFGGQSFMHDQLDKLKQAKSMITQHHNQNADQPMITLEVDGGINPETAKLCRSAGADVLVAGSSVFTTSNYRDNIDLLRG